MWVSIKEIPEINRDAQLISDQSAETIDGERIVFPTSGAKDFRHPETKSKRKGKKKGKKGKEKKMGEKKGRGKETKSFNLNFTKKNNSK